MNPNSKRERWYVGAQCGTFAREAFKSEFTPTADTHGNSYCYCVGPFDTKRGAEYLARYGSHDNPNLQTVAQAEKAARNAVQKKG